MYFSSEVNRFVGYLFLIVFLIQSQISLSQIGVKGKVVDLVQVGSSAETYAVYLPKGYQENKPTSIVIIFEPLGRGSFGLQSFIPAAETYNHILVCSNNAKNGPFQTNFEIANRLFAAVFETFDVDQNQIYLAGFSGGSRLASSIAVLTEQIQGVIACGAGFSPNSNHQPSFGHSFSYVGLVGTRDMNYQEMLQTERWLNILKINNTLFVNGDRHRWPPKEQISKAFIWLELRAYEKNLKSKDFKFLESAYKGFYQEAQAQEMDGKLVEAIYGYQRLVKDFSRYYKIDSIRNKLNNLKRRNSYMNTITHNKKLAVEEGVLKAMFDDKFAMEIGEKKANPKVKWWSKKVDKLNKEYLQSENRFRKSLGERIFYSVYALGVETGEIHLRNKNYEKALYCHKVLTILIPDNAFPFILTAKDHAQLGDDQQAMEYLNLALSKGVKDKAVVLAASEFDSIRQNEAFIKLLENK